MYSIIVPVYNGEKVIERCIQSVVDMSYSQWELIIVNDGSTDNTEGVCKKYLADKRIKLITQENGGVSRARNRGLQEAIGEYILFLDADDYVSEDICEAFDREMGDADFCLAGFVRHYPDGMAVNAKISIPIASQTYTLLEFSNVFGELYKSGFINSPWAKCYKRDKVTDYFNPDYCLGEDLIFNLHYMTNCKKIKVVFDPVYHYEIQNSGTLSSGLIDRSFEMLSEVYEDTKYLLARMFVQNNYEKYIQEKYLLDMMSILERHIRHVKGFRCVDMKAAIDRYQLNTIARKVKMNLGMKWAVGKFLIENKAYGIFWWYLKLFYWASRRKMHA